MIFIIGEENLESSIDMDVSYWSYLCLYDEQKREENAQ